MKKIWPFSILFLVLIHSCAPSLLFTREQFPDLYSDLSIPDSWHGQWVSSDSSFKCLIAKDTLSLIDFNYKIIPANLDLQLDSAQGRDKLVFMKDWCYLAFYTSIDSIPEISGYRMMVGKLEQDGTILGWEMTYDYFLKKRLIQQIPAIRFEYTALNQGGTLSNMEPTITYVPLPEDRGRLYRKTIKNITIVTSGNPPLCDLEFDFDFFKKVALSREPDLIMKTNHIVIKRPENRLEKKYRKMADRNYYRNYLKRIKADL